MKANDTENVNNVQKKILSSVKKGNRETKTRRIVKTSQEDKDEERTESI